MVVITDCTRNKMMVQDSTWRNRVVKGKHQELKKKARMKKKRANDIPTLVLQLTGCVTSKL